MSISDMTHRKQDHLGMLSVMFVLKRTIQIFIYASVFNVCNAQAMSDSPKLATGDQAEEVENKQNSIQEKCSRPAYVKMGEYLFRLPREDINGIIHQGKTKNVDCSTSRETPTQAEKLVFIKTIKLHQYEKPYRVQFQLETHPTSRRNQYQYIKKELGLIGKKIENLPKEQGFYKYTYNPKYEATHYISDHKTLTDIHGNPIVLAGCHHKRGLLACNVGFDWRSGIHVWIREIANKEKNLPRPKSINDWFDIYPVYLNVLETALVNDYEGDEK